MELSPGVSRTDSVESWRLSVEIPRHSSLTDRLVEPIAESHALEGCSASDDESEAIRSGTEYSASIASLDKLGGWQDGPVVVTPSTTGHCLKVDGVDQLGRIQVNTGRAIAVDGPLFTGRAVLYIKGLPSSPPDLFKGSKRKSLIAIQGRFKRPVPFNNLFTGQEFSRPAVNLPAPWVINNVLLRVARALCPSMVMSLQPPTVLMPVICGAQCLHVAQSEASAPDLTAAPVEDCRLLNAALQDAQGRPVSSAARKAFFTKRSHRSGQTFSRDLVYTFYLYQHLVDLSTYKLHMVKAFDLVSHVDGQPLKFLVKNQATGEYLLNFDIWHEKLLQTQPAASKAAG